MTTSPKTLLDGKTLAEAYQECKAKPLEVSQTRHQRGRGQPQQILPSSPVSSESRTPLALSGPRASPCTTPLSRIDPSSSSTGAPQRRQRLLLARPTLLRAYGMKLRDVTELTTKSRSLPRAPSYVHPRYFVCPHRVGCRCVGGGRDLNIAVRANIY